MEVYLGTDEKVNSEKNILDLALYYHSKGLCVLPAYHRTKRPAMSTWETFKTRRPTEEEVCRWFSSKEPLNIGVVAGPHSNTCIFDFDSDEAVEWGRKNGLNAIGPVVRSGGQTPTGGPKFHVYVKYKDGVTNLKGRPVSGFELRANGLFTILPPSVHEKTGRTYKWIKNLDDTPMGHVPNFIFEECQRKPAIESEKTNVLVETRDGALVGARHYSTVRLAGYLLYRGAHLDDVLAFCLSHNSRCKPPKADAEVEKAVKGVWKYYFAPGVRKRKIVPDELAAMFMEDAKDNLEHTSYGRKMAILENINTRAFYTDLIGEGVRFKNHERLSAICPFCVEDRPRMLIDLVGGYWYCLNSCGAGGVIEFFMRFYMLGYTDAVDAMYAKIFDDRGDF